MKNLSKTICLLTVSLALAVSAFGQTNNPPPAGPPLPGTELPPGPISAPVLSGPAASIVDFLTSASNIMVAPYGIASSDMKKFGAGLGIGFRVSEFVVPTLRLDYFDGTIWMPSASLQLQAPLKILGKWTVIPFAFGGLATPLSGKGVDNGSAVGIVGIGAAIRFGEKWDLIGDYEKWTGFSTDQIRVGFVYKF
jgi:hypothetical protein